MVSSDGAEPFAFTDWTRRVGIEREYKWSCDKPAAQALLAGRDQATALDSIKLPPGYRTHTRKMFSHQQDTAYLDDGWRLLDNESSISIIVNQGPTGQQSYLKTKQTIGWVGERRDAIELAEKVPLEAMTETVAAGEVLPVQYLSRQFGGALVLKPFATTSQERWKLNVFSDSASPMVVCWDICEITAVESGVTATSHHIEVETGMLDPRSCDELAALADAVSEFLGMSPDRLSKSRRAAAMCGRTRVG